MAWREGACGAVVGGRRSGEAEWWGKARRVERVGSF